jgi:hypothetical protein
VKLGVEEGEGRRTTALHGKKYRPLAPFIGSGGEDSAGQGEWSRPAIKSSMHQKILKSHASRA